MKTPMRHIAPIKLSGYITLLVWAALMFALVYGMHASTRDARRELSAAFMDASVAAPQARSIDRIEDVPRAIREQLAAGLEILRNTLVEYQTTVEAANESRP